MADPFLDLDPELLEQFTAEGVLAPEIATQVKLRALDAKMGLGQAEGFAKLFNAPPELGTPPPKPKADPRAKRADELMQMLAEYFQHGNVIRSAQSPAGEAPSTTMQDFAMRKQPIPYGALPKEIDPHMAPAWDIYRQSEQLPPTWQPGGNDYIAPDIWSDPRMTPKHILELLRWASQGTKR